MKNISHIFIVVLSFCTVIFSSCEKDTTDPSTPSTTDADEINYFIWASLHDYYLWNEKVSGLTNSYYNNNEDSLTNYLNRNKDHEAFFYSLLYDYGKTDKWSWIVDDYVALEKEFEGITKSMGHNFILARYGTENVLGCVSYVVKRSPADKAGIKRGDIFTQINDQQLTLSNYIQLLSNSESYKLSFATIDVANHTVVPNNRTVNLTAVEVTEDPIYLDTVYTVNNTKIGYLIYNSFTSNYDKELNNVMQRFKTEGVTKLILDLRYNGGGSLESSTYLASMIYGTSSKLFLKTQYNDLLEDYLIKEFGSDYLNVNFESSITNEDNSTTPIVSLNLPDLYVITTKNTASASESVINGLKPYMNVVTVGDTTHGKYVGSITIKDIIDAKGTVNPDHKWALQPIVLKIANSAGASDYIKGFAPQVLIDEDLGNMSVLGSREEPLLNKTIATITGVSAKNARMSSMLKVQKIPQLKRKNFESEMYFRNKTLPLNIFRK